MAPAPKRVLFLFSHEKVKKKAITAKSQDICVKIRGQSHKQYVDSAKDINKFNKFYAYCVTNKCGFSHDHEKTVLPIDIIKWGGK